MSAIRRASPKREPIRTDLWEERLIAEARRLRRRGGSGRFSASESAAIARDLISLQRGLTGERNLIGSSYMDERDRLACYLLFYWPVSRAQALGLLTMAYGIEKPPRDEGRPLRILDLGSGPAPCSLAAADWYGAPDARILAYDRSAAALESGRRLAESAGYGFTGVSGWDAARSAAPEGSFDVIALGHVLNELWKDADDRVARRRDFIQRTADSLAPDGILLILEPATLSGSRDMLSLRDLLLESGLAVRAPCLRDGPCPAVAIAGQSCHSDFDWEPNPTVKELSRRTGLDKGLVKTAGFVFAKKPGKRGVDPGYRVVSEPMLNKAGRSRILICGEDGRFPLSAKPGEGFPAERVFRSLRRSDRIRITDAARRESGLALGEDTRIERIPADRS